ncbi:hypothetical protein [Gilvimarinus chinensis]|uniref:hypothetical protein n=1 Tax=Gilvimarinus chinensis TaxID=396005 RepID=UPI00037036FA|nr:hypothetical protein [Gilvimarinus chinensis]
MGPGEAYDAKAIGTEKHEALARWETYQETGEVVSNDAMTEWLDSWGTDAEKPCPVK